MSKEEKHPVKNLYMSAMTTGSGLDAEIISLGLTCGNDSLYIERTDLDLEKLAKTEEMEQVLANLRMNSQESHKETIENPDRSHLIEYKDHDYKIKIEAAEWFNEVSEFGHYKLKVWTENPVAWIFFINLTMGFEGYTPEIPEFIDPYPADFNTLAYIFLDGQSVDDIYPQAPDIVEYNSFGRVQFIKDMIESIFDRIIDPAKANSKISTKPTEE